MGPALPFYLMAIHQSDWRWLVAFLFIATALLYAFTPAIMTITQSLVEPRMRASAAALQSFGQTVAGLGLGSVLLGYLSDRLAAWLYKGNYAADCLGSHAGPPPAACVATAASGLQSSMQLCAAVLLIAVWHYVRAARTLPLETESS